MGSWRCQWGLVRWQNWWVLVVSKSLNPSRTNADATSLRSSFGRPQSMVPGAWIHNDSTINVCHFDISHSHLSLITKPNNKNSVQNNKLKHKYPVNVHRFHSRPPLPRQPRFLLLWYHLLCQLWPYKDSSVAKIEYMEEIKDMRYIQVVSWEVAKNRIGISHMVLAPGVTGNLIRASQGRLGMARCQTSLSCFCWLLWHISRMSFDSSE